MLCAAHTCWQRKSSERPGAELAHVQGASSCGRLSSSMPCHGTGALQRGEAGTARGMRRGGRPAASRHWASAQACHGQLAWPDWRYGSTCCCSSRSAGAHLRRMASPSVRSTRNDTSAAPPLPPAPPPAPGAPPAAASAPAAKLMRVKRSTPQSARVVGPGKRHGCGSSIRSAARP